MLAKVGQPAPAFTLASTKGATSPKNLGAPISLADYRGKWLIFFFYPLDFTFVCPTEILALSDRYDEITELGAEVLGASTDSVFSHFAWVSTPRDKNGIAGLEFPLVADFTKEIARAYGVSTKNPGSLSAVYSSSTPRACSSTRPSPMITSAVRSRRRCACSRRFRRAACAPPSGRPASSCSRSRNVPLRMRTPLPSLDGVAAWINGGQPTAADLTGHPVLVHFWSISCYICHDVVERVNAWRDKYGPQGLKVVAIHQPRGPEELDVEKVTADALGAMGLTQPLAIDNEHTIVADLPTSSSRHTTFSTATTSCATSRRATRATTGSKPPSSGFLPSRKQSLKSLRPSTRPVSRRRCRRVAPPPVLRSMIASDTLPWLPHDARVAELVDALA